MLCFLTEHKDSTRSSDGIIIMLKALIALAAYWLRLLFLLLAAAASAGAPPPYHGLLLGGGGTPAHAAARGGQPTTCDEKKCQRLGHTLQLPAGRASAPEEDAIGVRNKGHTTLTKKHHFLPQSGFAGGQPSRAD